jgi:hypothetical protein
MADLEQQAKDLLPTEILSLIEEEDWNGFVPFLDDLLIRGAKLRLSNFVEFEEDENLRCKLEVFGTFDENGEISEFDPELRGEAGQYWSFETFISLSAIEKHLASDGDIESLYSKARKWIEAQKEWSESDAERGEVYKSLLKYSVRLLPSHEVDPENPIIGIEFHPYPDVYEDGDGEEQVKWCIKKPINFGCTFVVGAGEETSGEVKSDVSKGIGLKSKPTKEKPTSPKLQRSPQKRKKKKAGNSTY